MQKLSSILIASILVVGALAVMPIDNAYAGHIVTANTLGNAVTGIAISAAGVITDLDGNVVIADTVDLGSATTGIRVTTLGVITDIDGAVVTIADGLAIGVAVADTFSIATAGTDTINIGTDTTDIDDINIGSPTDNFSIESDAFTVTDAGVISDLGGSLVLADTVVLGSAATGLTITLGGAISDNNANVIIDDIVDLGSATAGIRIDTAGTIIDIDGAVTIADGTTIGSAGVDNFNWNTAGGDFFNIGTNGAADTITIGSALDTFALFSTNLQVTNTGIISDAVGNVEINDGTTIGSTAADTFNWNTAGGDTFSFGTNAAVDTFTIGGSATDTIGFFGAAAVVQQTVAAVTSAFGTSNGALVSIGDTSTINSGAAINDNFQDVVTAITNMKTAMDNLGLTT